MYPTVDAGFSLTAVGDCMAGRPLRPLLERDQDAADACERLHGSDVGFANLETGIFDVRGFAGWLTQAEDWALVGPPLMAHELRSLGFNLMSRANNHAVDWSLEGLRQTGRRLDEAGIIHAGAGETLAEARAPRYLETAKGRVALVSFHTTTPSDGSQALDQFGQIPARPGISSLRLRVSIKLTNETFDELRRVEGLLDPFGMNTVPVAGSQHFSLFGTQIERGDTAVAFEPFTEDVAQILHAVRCGKQLSDLLIVSAHVHEHGCDAVTPPAFLTDLAHALVDQGADVVVGHGVHHLWPIEMYRGRPILYGLGNFIADDMMGPLPQNLYRDAREQVDLATATDADVIDALIQANFDDVRYYQSVIARIDWADRRFTTTLYPIDLGFGMPLTRRGLPHLARGSDAREILEQIGARCPAVGTDVVLEGDVAVVRATEMG